MSNIILTDTDGETHRAERTHPIPDNVDPVAFMDDRTPDSYTVNSVEEIDADAELDRKIAEAGTLDELKDALRGRNGNARVRGRRNGNQ